MIPAADRALANLAMKLAADLVPALSDSYDVSNALMIAMLLGALAKETAAGVDNRMTDAEELKVLFAAAESAPGADRRAGFSSSEPASLKLEDVTRWLDEGLDLLIDLHAWAEDHDPATNQAIWGFLSRQAERHRLDV